MKMRLLIFISCFVLNFTCTSISANDAFHKRNGLPNFSQKAKNSRFLHIAYLGGSITAAADGWRDLTCNWFRVNFPYTIISQTNGGIGGTGSDLGACRVESDILSRTPDLIFIEFAVNDGGKSGRLIQKSMEGIVRKIWSKSPLTDICFVYTVDESKCNKLLEGKLDSAVIYMEEIAGYYGIPSIHMGFEVARLLKQNKLVFSGDPKENASKIVFTQDKVHPLTESGHPVYASQIIRYMPEMLKSAKTSPHQIPNPLLPDNWSDAKKVSLKDLKKSGDWQLLPEDDILMKSFSTSLPEIFKGTPGNKLQFSFTGTAFGIFDILGPKSGILRVMLDGEQKEFIRFDKYCSYNRPAYTILFDDLENKLHHVEIEVLDKSFDKSAILNAESLEIYKKNPVQFQGTEYFIGNILLVGKL